MTYLQQSGYLPDVNPNDEFGVTRERIIPIPFDVARDEADQIANEVFPPLDAVELIAFAEVASDPQFAQHLPEFASFPRWRMIGPVNGSSCLLLEHHGLIQPIADEAATVHVGGMVFTLTWKGHVRISATREIFAIARGEQVTPQNILQLIPDVTDADKIA